MIVPQKRCVRILGAGERRSAGSYRGVISNGKAIEATNAFERRRRGEVERAASSTCVPIWY